MLKVKLALKGELKDTIERDISNGAKAVTLGVEETGETLKKRLAGMTSRANLGKGMAKSWKTRRYPKKGNSLGAAVVIYSDAERVIRAFDEGAVIKPKGRRLLAIPTENAPKRGVGRKRISPATFPEARYGELRLVKPKNGPLLLVVDGVRILKSGRVGKRLKNDGRTKTGKYRKGVTTVVMFILVPQAKLKKRLNVSRPSRVAYSRLMPTILKHWNRLDPV